VKICVTGANGFVGSHLCKALIDRGDQVVGLVRKTADLEFIRDLKGLEICTGDIADSDSLQHAFDGACVVYHVAGYVSDWGEWRVFQAVNIGGVENVIRSAIACGVARVVHMSSVSVYGFPDGNDIGEDQSWVQRPEDPYVTSKQQGEKIALSFNGAEIEVTALRPGGIYGPNDRITSLKLFPEIARRRFLYVDGGRHATAPVYIDNLVQAAVLAGDHPSAPGQVYNIVDDGATSWRQYIEWICEDLDCARPLISVPSWIAWPLACVIEAVAKAGDTKSPPPVTKYRIRAVMGDSRYSSDTAKRELGYAPEISTREGIRRTVEWYLNYTGRSP